MPGAAKCVDQFDFNPLRLVGGFVGAGTKADGSDAAAEIVIRQARQLPVDFLPVLFQLGQGRIFWRSRRG